MRDQEIARLSRLLPVLPERNEWPVGRFASAKQSSAPHLAPATAASSARVTGRGDQHRHQAGKIQERSPQAASRMPVTVGTSGNPELIKYGKRHPLSDNKLHWVRVVTYQEDKSLVRTGNAPRVMATLRIL